MGNQIKVGNVKFFNSGVNYTLYAHFSSTGHFLYFQYGKFITCFVDDILEDKRCGLLNADIVQLDRIEKLK